ncbi:primase-helicase family protein [Methylocapsa palsarum]|nr:primase-helicase family protein [Methylocapsa palsarum]
MAINAGEAESKGFLVHCLHSHCVGRDRTAFVEQMLETGWLWSDDLTNPSFLLPAPEIDEVERAVQRLNKDHALITLGSNVRVLSETSGRDGVPRIAFLKVADFRTKFANDMVPVGGKQTGVASLWLAHRQRRGYEELVFAPGENVAGAYNLFRGWSVAADANASCDLLLAHLKNNVCGGNEAHFDWVVAFFADIIQNPGKKPGVALVLRGEEGGGKTAVGKYFGKIMPARYTSVSQPRHLLGNFNAHLERTLLLQADEASWAGDKTGDGVLKDLITNDTMRIERKGLEAVVGKNSVRVLMTSNKDWVVPAGPAARRYGVFDVRAVKHSTAEREAFEHEMNTSGPAAFLHYLQCFDLTRVDLAAIPKTDALFEQKLETLPPLDSWLLDCLREGQLAGEEGPAEIQKTDVYRSYEAFAKRKNTRALDVSMFWRSLRKMLKIETRESEYKPRDTGGAQRRIFLPPALTICREHFSDHLKSPINWDEN